jgi:hypothetical protein
VAFSAGGHAPLHARRSGSADGGAVDSARRRAALQPDGGLSRCRLHGRRTLTRSSRSPRQKRARSRILINDPDTSSTSNSNVGLRRCTDSDSACVCRGARSSASLGLERCTGIDTHIYSIPADPELGTVAAAVLVATTTSLRTAAELPPGGSGILAAVGDNVTPDPCCRERAHDPRPPRVQGHISSGVACAKTGMARRQVIRVSATSSARAKTRL